MLRSIFKTLNFAVKIGGFHKQVQKVLFSVGR